MKNLLAAMAFVLTIGSASAEEYSKGTYSLYGYSSAAAIMTSLGLKGGLRGARNEDLNEKGNSYYPGYPWMQASLFIHPR